MPFRVKCDLCGCCYDDLPLEYRGQKVVCGGCDTEILIPAPEPVEPETEYVATVPSAESELPGGEEISTRCTFCGAEYQLAREYVGMELECPGCEKVFVAADTASVASAVEPVAEKSSSVPEPVMEDDENDDRTIKIKRPGGGAHFEGTVIPKYDVQTPEFRIPAENNRPLHRSSVPESKVAVSIEESLQAPDSEPEPFPAEPLPWYLFWKRFFKRR